MALTIEQKPSSKNLWYSCSFLATWIASVLCVSMVTVVLVRHILCRQLLARVRITKSGNVVKAPVWCTRKQ